MLQWLPSSGQLREYDFLARYAGDEFVALVQEVAGTQVEELCIRIESAVSQFSLTVGLNGFARVGVSVGTATFGTDGETLDHLIISADNEMYRVKSNHRLERGAPTSVSVLSVQDGENLASVPVG